MDLFDHSEAARAIPYRNYFTNDRNLSGFRTRKDDAVVLSEASINTPEKIETLAALVTKAMDRIGVDHRLERENEALRHRLAELEKQLEKK